MPSPYGGAPLTSSKPHARTATPRRMLLRPLLVRTTRPSGHARRPCKSGCVCSNSKRLRADARRPSGRCNNTFGTLKQNGVCAELCCSSTEGQVGQNGSQVKARGANGLAVERLAVQVCAFAAPSSSTSSLPLPLCSQPASFSPPCSPHPALCSRSVGQALSLAAELAAAIHNAVAIRCRARHYTSPSPRNEANSCSRRRTRRTAAECR